SHNQDIAWLPRQLAALGVGTPDAEHCGAALGHIHWTWIGWLLRLADIFDCDSSRTPRILFDHAGITDLRSQTEWKKHLSIREPPVWEAGADGKTLLYTCQLSPAPVVEKATLQIIGWMNDELKNCRAAWNSVPAERRKGMTFAIPSEAKLEIKARAENYLYQDIEFRLDRDAVVELLMGESLYGGPELALRELVQNALDAVHLRDQRNKLAEAIELSNSTDKPRFPSEPWGAVKGKVEVTWGNAADGRSWVKVSDNGVGMTIDTMRRFLTQVGKSYYKSDDFRAEQNLMRRHDILCTAISQFGIGFLSVFMLADHVEIHTRPIGAPDRPDRTRSDWQESQRFPFRADIHGPHGLLAFYPDHNIPRPGTTVTVWLKPGFKLADWDRDLVIARLKQEFYQKDLYKSDQERLQAIKNTPSAGAQLLDPAFEISRFIVWPLYPVHLGPSSGSIVLDDCFHFQELVPLDAEALRGKATEWGEEIPEAVRCGWQRCEWTDRQTGLRGAEGTGTRIRLVTPQPDGQLANVMTLNQWGQLPDALPSGKSRSCLATFAEPQLPAPQWRYQCLVNGVRIVPGFIPANSERDCLLPMILQQMTLVPGPGGWVWIDLRGEAMPRLRADRSLPVRTQSETWELQSLMQRWLQSVPARPPVWLVSTIQSPEIRNRLRTQHRHRIGLPGMGPLAVAAHLI
ncbi:MAG: hypothetical protein ACKON9_04065, partial [Planctomycetaceae bacterium]